MNYKENDKVTIQSQDWYEQNKQPNGFIIYKKDGNKVATFSPGMLKFCGQTFTVGKVITGSSIYPDHYTFIEDGGAYKWTDEMIAGLADSGAQTYVREAAPAASKPAPKPVEKPAPKPEPKPTPKEEVKPAPKPEPKPVEAPKPAPKEEVKPAPKPEPKPTPKEEVKSAPKPEPKPVEAPKPEPKVEIPDKQSEPEHQDEGEISAFESFTLLLKPRNGAAFADCATQAFKIMAANSTFPSATFNFNGFEITIARK